MVTFPTFQQLALSFPDAEQEPHFHLVSFRFRKKIFATYREKEQWAMLKLPLPEQSVFCAFDHAVFFPVPGSWGAKGATFVDLKKLRKDMFKDALTVAYNAVAVKKKL